jgi:uncharacterized protein
MPYKSVKASDLFTCKKCGECCRGYGGTYVSGEDIQAMAEYLHVDESGFVARYCSLSGNRTLIAQGENGFCVFFREDLCTIHPVKPKMCKAWPFIEPVLKDAANWHIMAGFCPGIRTDVPNDIIQKLVRNVISGR